MSTESKLPRLTIDTNNVVSAILNPGNYASLLLTAWMEGKCHWIQSEQTLNELAIVLRRERFQSKYGLQPQEITQLLEAIGQGTEMVTPLPLERLPVRCRDPKDDKFLALAFGGAADYLITQDEDLLVLAGMRELGNLTIETAGKFVGRGS